jgi:hypothetical protein
MTLRPWRTLGALANDRRAFLKSLLLLLLIIAVYTFILIAFMISDYPAAAPSALPLTVEEQYPVQVWYQGPLFLVTTALPAGVLVLAARLLGGATSFRLAYARMAYVSVIPFFFTTMVVELVIAVLLLAGAVQPAATMSWLTGAGSWFPLIYQLVSILWIAALFVTAARQTVGRGWLAALAVGLLALALYALPVALLIR